MQPFTEYNFELLIQIEIETARKISVSVRILTRVSKFTNNTEMSCNLNQLSNADCTENATRSLHERVNTNRMDKDYCICEIKPSQLTCNGLRLKIHQQEVRAICSKLNVELRSVFNNQGTLEKIVMEGSKRNGHLAKVALQEIL